MLQKYRGQYFDILHNKSTKRRKRPWIITRNNSEFAIQIVVAKKIVKKATRRNLIKRRLLGAFLQNRSNAVGLDRIKGKICQDTLRIHAKTESISANFASLHKEIADWIEKSRL